MGQLPAFSMQLGDVCGHGVGNAGGDGGHGNGISGTAYGWRKWLGDFWFFWLECEFSFVIGDCPFANLGLPKILGIVI